MRRILFALLFAAAAIGQTTHLSCSGPCSVDVTITLAPVVPPPVVPPPVVSAAGIVRIVKRTNPGFDTYTNSTSPATWQWMRDHFWRACVYTPYFNSKTAQYPNGWVYKDVYDGRPVIAAHPDWILKSAGGQNLFINWGCANGSCPQPAADFGNPAFRAWWIADAKAQLAGGKYKGLWVDDINLDFRISDGNGTFVNPRDPRTGAPMTIDNWRRYMAEFTELIRAQIPGELLHNSVWSCGDAARDLNPYIQRQIKAADAINIEFGVNDSGLTGGTGQWSLNAMLAYIDRLNVMGKSVVIEGVNGGTSDAALEYRVANYFLVSNGNDAIGDYVENVITPDHFWTGLNVNLGAPAAGRFVWSGLLRRDFAAGMVLVNEPGAPSRTVTLPGTYHRVDGTAVTSMTLGAATGAVLVK